MNNNIKYLVEDYFTNTEQLTNTMKNTTKAQKKYEKTIKAEKTDIKIT